MGREIWLVEEGDDQCFDEDDIRSYYEFKADKERRFYSDDDREPTAQEVAESRIDKLDDKSEDTRGIWEYWPDEVVFVVDTDKLPGGTPLYGNAIQEMIDELRAAIEILEEKEVRDDDTDWEATLELGAIVLAEYALENDLGIDIR
ncbi:hypothetical protein [Halomicrobium salinisoli]|uniref:hypothetical protein n=1 Tax=Halomicrobium salinisoli TaxID=2878391 RepID=UPI001CEFB8B6|nr:hypothetical protein [Halomicrobium salinisoli]